MRHLLIAGGGFAGLWAALSAVGAARALDQGQEITITLINKDGHHGLRPRFYDDSLSTSRLPLAHWLTPLGVDLVIGDMMRIAPDTRRVYLRDGRQLCYDSLILATGSHMPMPDGLGQEPMFSVDTFAQAMVLDQHLCALAKAGFPTLKSRSFVVCGAGFTGLEIITALPQRLKSLAPTVHDFTFHLIDRAEAIALPYEPSVRDYIQKRLEFLRIQVHCHETIEHYEDGRLVLSSGTTLATATVIAATGLVASPLTAAFLGTRDDKGRITVDKTLRLPHHPEVFAAGDVALAQTDPDHCALMSCQHAMPQGRVAGHNAVNQLLGHTLIPYSQALYNTCLDLGPGDGVLTTGWGREAIAMGPEAKARKTDILKSLIVPPWDLKEALTMATPTMLASG